MKIPIAKTKLLEEDILSVLEPLRSGWLVQGPKVAEFERLWSDFTGVKNSIAVTSCTSALHLSLAALGFGPGDEAIVPSFTWISTANVVEHLGGKVVFADIDLNTFNIDPDDIESKITKRTKAIIPVHLFGLSANMDSILRIANKYSLRVIEDAACGFGSYFRNKHVGNFGDTGCFSFHPRKSITTGEGGMITTNDDDLAEKLRRLRNHGASLTDLQRHLGPKPYLLSDHLDAGYNQRMTDFQAAMGITQLKRGKEILSERKEIASKYNDELINMKLLTPKYNSLYVHGYQSFPCIFDFEEVNKSVKEKNIDKIKKIKLKRNKLMETLQDQGISTRPATHAVHMLTFFKDKYKLSEDTYIKSMAANECSLSLPLYNGMTKKEQDYVIDVLKKELT